jgi:cell wall-associated NlpC family hydrolase
MAASFDPRVTAARGDLAARHLEGRVVADRFVDAESRVVLEPVAPLRRAPQPDAALETEALLGETAAVYETTDEGWAWVQLDGDGYVGWMPAAALAAPRAAATHRVSVTRTLAFPGPSIKAPPTRTLPLGARLAVLRTRDIFAVTDTGEHVPARHLAPLGTFEPDFVAVAERFLHTPYLWGGKTVWGIDCSGLVQVALAACGIACPRDSDMQEAALGTAVDVASDDLRRGDLVFWKGHVGIVRDAATLLHANAFHMAVALEPLGEAFARIAASEGAPRAVRRL